MIFNRTIEDILGPEDPIDDTELRYSVGSGTDFGRATNIKSTWGKLCAKLSNPLHVTESRADFDCLPPKQQTQLKARAGWFVGAPIANKHRRKGNILKRQFVTLDADQVSLALYMPQSEPEPIPCRKPASNGCGTRRPATPRPGRDCVSSSS